MVFASIAYRSSNFLKLMALQDLRMVGTIAARYVLKMSPLMTLGGLAGAQTCTPGLNALREASDSNIGSLAYTVPYAIGNILLTVWGAVVVAIVHAMRG
jgi:putative transport protein